MLGNIPQGKGIYIWNIDQVHNGDVDLIAESLHEANFQWAAIKIADGIVHFPYRDRHGNKIDMDQARVTNQSLILALARHGIKSWAWAYTYGVSKYFYPMAKTEATRVVDWYKSYQGFEGFFIDAEREYKRRNQIQRGCVFL